MSEVKSPCTNKCDYNYKENICFGCFRTIAEIMVWPSLSNKEKELVLRKSVERKSKKEAFDNDKA